jgi:hypothetical protein
VANNEEGLNIGNMMSMMIGIIMISLISKILPQPKGHLDINSFEIS